VAPEIKFCGLTRRVDAQLAARLGARYVGVIFAGGPRLLTPERAATVVGWTERAVARVGVFGAQSADEVARIADQVRLDIVQLHADPRADIVASVRARSGRVVWAVARVGVELPARVAELFDAADAVVLDARVPGHLGGSGVAFDWAAVRAGIDRTRGTRRLVLAGGLTPDNVGEAIRLLRPDVVDVSSGVESAAGLKSPALMRRFVQAVAGSEVAA
jgi:phosphoribosylanthranilate isomerase